MLLMESELRVFQGFLEIVSYEPDAPQSKALHVLCSRGRSAHRSTRKKALAPALTRQKMPLASVRIRGCAGAPPRMCLARVAQRLACAVGRLARRNGQDGRSQWDVLAAYGRHSRSARRVAERGGRVARATHAMNRCVPLRPGLTWLD